MKCVCTHCGESLWQDRNPEGLNYCTNCRKLFVVLAPPEVPTWMWGVVAFILVNWQIMRTV
jgi:hypothetical protein